MNKLLLSLGLLLTIHGSGKITEDCRCGSMPMYGRVKVVERFADYKVQVVTSFSNLNVQKVESFPDKCGRWQFVDSHPDFTIQYVNSFPDFKIKFVESFPGVSNSLH